MKETLVNRTLPDLLTIRPTLLLVVNALNAVGIYQGFVSGSFEEIRDYRTFVSATRHLPTPQLERVDLRPSKP